MAQADPQGSQAVIDFSSGVLSANPLTASLNSFGATGLAGVADEGMKITGPIVIDGIQRAPASPGLKWLGRGLLGTWDALSAYAQHLGAIRC